MLVAFIYYLILDKTLNDMHEFKYQRNLMGAGGCEASAFKAFGYKVTGLAYPLGNWHNRGSKKVEEEYNEALLMDDEELIQEKKLQLQAYQSSLTLTAYMFEEVDEVST